MTAVDGDGEDETGDDRFVVLMTPVLVRSAPSSLQA